MGVHKSRHEHHFAQINNSGARAWFYLQPGANLYNPPPANGYCSVSDRGLAEGQDNARAENHQ
jgi:hypothetical protein